MSVRRTTTRRRREMARFLTDNRRLFPFAGSFLVGAVLGVVLYRVTGNGTDWGGLLTVSGLSGGLKDGLHALWGACFPSVFWLAVLFLLGLWSCGAPFALLVPMLHGVGLGLTEGCYYAMGRRGIAAVAAVIMPHGLLGAAVLIMAGAESTRLSMELSRQLLPARGDLSGTPSGELWPTFRLYCLRFLLFLSAAMAVGLLDVLARTLLWRLLPT